MINTLTFVPLWSIFSENERLYGWLKMTDDQVKEAIDLLRSGESLRSVGRIMSLHPYTVKYHVEKVTFEFRDAQRERRKKWEMKDALELREDGHTYQEISDVMGIPSSTIRKAFSRYLKKLNSSKDF